MKKVLLGVSGGVDSAVAAHLLQEAGYTVVGAFLNLWNEDEAQKKQSLEDAASVCDLLGIRLVEVDRQEDFNATIVDYFTKEYMNGRTPNPCTLCNATIKIPSLIDAATDMGISHVATGHYAHTNLVDLSTDSNLRASQSRKDQSYALCMLTRSQLSRLILPLGTMEDKDATRRIAEEIGLGVAQKSDSQEICFIRDNNYKAFLRRLGFKGEPGDLVLDGEIVGQHSGIENYTIGQRKGLGAFGKPVFVRSIDPVTNIIDLSGELRLVGKTMYISRMNYISRRLEHAVKNEAELGGYECFVKIRYSAKPAKCVVSAVHGEGRLFVEFKEPQRAITSGQTAAFYDADGYVLGGAVID